MRRSPAIEEAPPVSDEGEYLDESDVLLASEAPPTAEPRQTMLDELAPDRAHAMQVPSEPPEERSDVHARETIPTPNRRHSRRAYAPPAVVTPPPAVVTPPPAVVTPPPAVVAPPPAAVVASVVAAIERERTERDIGADHPAQGAHASCA